MHTWFRVRCCITSSPELLFRQLANLPRIILEAYTQCQMPTTAFNTRDSVLNSFCDSLLSRMSTRDTLAVSRRDFLSCVSFWLLEDLGISRGAIEANVPMKTITQNNPATVVSYPDAVEADIDIRTLCWCYEQLDSLHKSLFAG
jgi:hypothetical protein